MSLDHFDAHIAPHLDALQYCGNRVSSLTRSIRQTAFVLRSRPDFRTLAETALEQAERELAEALARVRDARSHYTALPLDGGRHA